MDAITSTLLSGVIVIVGRIAKGEPITQRIIFAIIILGLMLSLLGDANPELGKMFAALILVAVTLVYGVPVLRKMGFTK